MEAEMRNTIFEKLKKSRLANIIKRFRKQGYRRRPIWKVNFSSGVDFEGVNSTFDLLFDNLKNKEKTVYLRFGDGEVNLINNRGHRDQESSKEVVEELKQSFSLKGEGVIKGLPLHSDIFGKECFMEEGVHWRDDNDAISLLSGCFEYFTGSKIYSPVPLHYLMVYEKNLAISFLKEIKAKSPIFVGGEQNQFSIINDVVGASDFIKVPDQNAYKKIAEVEKALRKAIVSKNSDFTVVVFSCGVLAKALSKRLWEANDLGDLYLFDLGSVIDVFHGRDRWTWVKKSGIDKFYIDDFISQIS
jgi:hypothetical protein